MERLKRVRAKELLALFWRFFATGWLLYFVVQAGKAENAGMVRVSGFAWAPVCARFCRVPISECIFGVGGLSYGERRAVHLRVIPKRHRSEGVGAATRNGGNRFACEPRLAIFGWASEHLAKDFGGGFYGRFAIVGHLRVRVDATACRLTAVAEPFAAWAQPTISGDLDAAASVGERVFSLPDALARRRSRANEVHPARNSVLHESHRHHLATTCGARVEHDYDGLIGENRAPARERFLGACAVRQLFDDEEVAAGQVVAARLDAVAMPKLDRGEMTFVEQETAAFQDSMHQTPAVETKVEHDARTVRDLVDGGFDEVANVVAVESRDAQVGEVVCGQTREHIGLCWNV